MNRETDERGGRLMEEEDRESVKKESKVSKSREGLTYL